jgi:hypothetical protein
VSLGVLGTLAAQGDAVVVDDNVGSLPGQLEGVLTAEAATRAGHDRDASFQISVIASLTPRRWMSIGPQGVRPS